MNRYLIETPHTKEECMQLIRQVLASGYLHHFDWGCKADVHVGWAIIEAADDAEAILAVPTMVRRKARVIRLTHFSEEQVKAMHAEG